MTIIETSEKILRFTASKSEFKGGMDKICGPNNETIEFIKGIIEGSDVTIGRTGNEIKITDRYGVGLGEMVLSAFNGLKTYSRNNQSTREKSIPQHIIRNAFSDVTTALHTKRKTELMETFKNNNIEIKVPNSLIIKPRNDNQKRYMSSLKLSQNSYILGIGEAGTGKTFLAVAAAAEALDAGIVEKIILTRPAVEAGENLGFLPGNAKEKMDPYMQPLYDALNETIPKKQLDEYMKDGTIEVSPLAFMRGRTLKNAFVILDEAQNTNTEQMKMFLTRMGENCHVAICGDVTQNDLQGRLSGLEDIISRLKEHPSDIYHQFLFNERDVVRSDMAKETVNIYANSSAGSKTQRDTKRELKVS